MSESIRVSFNAAGQGGVVPRWLAYAASFWAGFTIMFERRGSRGV